MELGRMDDGVDGVISACVILVRSSILDLRANCDVQSWGHCLRRRLNSSESDVATLRRGKVAATRGGGGFMAFTWAKNTTAVSLAHSVLFTSRPCSELAEDATRYRSQQSLSFSFSCSLPS